MSTLPGPVDLFDPAVFGDGPPHAVFDRLRAEAPVYWNAREADPDGGFWALTRHADVVGVSRDTARFTSTLGFTAPREPMPFPEFAENIMYRDPPAHTAHRRPLNRMFTPKAMQELEPVVRSIVVKIIDEVSALAAFDWVPRVAAEVPARVVATVIGVPEGDHGKLVEWASGIFGRDGTPERNARFSTAVGQISAYAETLKADRRVCPADDAMSALLEARVDASPLSEAALTMWFLTLAQAGFETTHTLIAQGMLLLSQRADVRRRLTTERAAIARAVEEMLRYITPVNMMGRTAVADVEVGGHLVRAGQYVTMWYAAANRDPAVFDNPHDFDLDRSPNNHQAFGGSGSPHYCLGAHLARLEMRVLLEEMAARGFPFEVSGPPTRMPGVFMNALVHLPVRAGHAGS